MPTVTLQGATAVIFLLFLTTVNADQCADQQSSLLSEADTWPHPTGALSSYINSFSSVHSGVFSNCAEFTTPMPASLTSPYAAWQTSVDSWTSSFDDKVSSVGQGCVAIVAPVVIALPMCGDVQGAGSSAATTTSAGSGSSSGSVVASASSVVASAIASATASSTGGSSSSSAAGSFAHPALSVAVLGGLGALGALAFAL